MRLQEESLTKIKNYTHATQGALIFLAWALTIAVFTSNGHSDSRTGWFFALVRTLPSAGVTPSKYILVLALVPRPHLPLHGANVA